MEQLHFPQSQVRQLNRLGAGYDKKVLTDFLVYYRLSPPPDPGEVVDALVWPYW